MIVAYTLGCVALGYLLGSIPFALVIGKVFYKTDIRQYGSGNLGGTNAGRVLGKNAGIAVIICDVLKVVVSIWVASTVSQATAIWTGLACCIGHCYPVFAHFKGGKAVSTMFGFLLATWIFIFKQPAFFFVPLGMFLIVLYLFKYVSLASMCASICSSLFITAQFASFEWNHIYIIVASWCMTILVIYRHRGNIEKILNATENKITWL